MNATAFTELGRRLSARRQEAHLSISIHGLLGRLRTDHGLPLADAQRISDYYCKRHTPTRAPLWW